MTETPETPPQSGSPAEPESLSVIIRPWPKVIFLYPTFVCATIFWFIQLLQGGGGGDAPGADPAAGVATAADAVGSATLGNIFAIVLAINLLLFSFDFSRIKSITILVAIIALVLGIGWADSTWGIAGGIKDVLGAIDIRMNTQFYGFMSGFLFLIILLVLVNTRFNYYEINHREILHHHGYLGDITRMPTQGLRLHKEIYDLLEYLLLRSGRLVFYPSTSREAIVIDNVINVNKVEKRIKNLLSVVAVRFTDPEQV